MADEAKMSEQIDHHEVHPGVTGGVPDFIRVDGGVLVDAGTKNEHHLKLAQDGHVSNCATHLVRSLTVIVDGSPTTAFR